MKSFMKKTVAVVLALVMLSACFVSSAAYELNEEAIAKHYGQYKNYLLLGDSAASGYRDVMSGDDDAHNIKYNQSTYCRYPGSYADIIANSIVEDSSMTALAAPGFRTIEMRYMLEDDYAATCEDEYLFWPSQLYVYQNQTCACCGEKMLPGSEHFRNEFKKSIAEADLITLGIGGNDWGAYLKWVIEEIFIEQNVGDEFMDMFYEVFEKSTMDIGTIEKVVEIAHLAGALPALLTKVPSALEYGLSTFYENWNIMIQDILALNPDVTLVVVGMSDNSVKGKYYDYNGVEGAPVIAEGEEPSEMEALATKTIVEAIMTVANTPMINGAEEFGYIYVDTAGTTYVDSHPDADGHRFIADKIIEALPDPVISKQFSDVAPGHKYYKDIEYVVANGIMSGTTETTFSPDEAFTNGNLSEAMNAITGADSDTDNDSATSVLKFAISLFTASFKKGFTGIFKGIAVSFRVFADNAFGMKGGITRAQAAKYLREFCEI